MKDVDKVLICVKKCAHFWKMLFLFEILCKLGGF